MQLKSCKGKKKPCWCHFVTLPKTWRKYRIGCNFPDWEVKEVECWFVVRAREQFHLLHWVSLLMARQREGWRRRWCVEVREGHSRPAAPRAEEPGSASPQTEPALFLGGRTLRRGDCAPHVSTPVEASRGRSAYESVLLPETTPKAAAALFETEAGGDYSQCVDTFRHLKGSTLEPCWL